MAYFRKKEVEYVTHAKIDGWCIKQEELANAVKRKNSENVNDSLKKYEKRKKC